MVTGVPLHDRHERLREHVPEQFNELVPLARHEALPVLPEGPTSHVVDVEEVVGGAADLRAPLFARVDANPRRTQPGEPARHRRGHEIERPDLRTGDRRDVVTRRRPVSKTLTGDREHEHEAHEAESLAHVSKSTAPSLRLVLDLGPTGTGRTIICEFEYMTRHRMSLSRRTR